MRVVDINSDVLRKFIAEKREKDLLGDPTIRRILVMFRSMLNQAKKESRIRHTDVPHFPMPADSKPRKGFIQPDQFAKLHDALPQNLRPLIKFCYYTGCRIGAAQKITWDMVSRDCSEIELSGDITKNGEPLTLPLVGPLAEIATMLKKMFRDKSKPVFSHHALRKGWCTTCHKLGFGVYDEKTRKYTGLTIHDLRRSAARNLIRAGVDRGTAMSITGHLTEHIFERYNIKTTDDRKAALLKVGDYAKQVEASQAAKS
jgi:integrase